MLEQEPLKGCRTESEKVAKITKEKTNSDEIDQMIEECSWVSSVETLTPESYDVFGQVLAHWFVLVQWRRKSRRACGALCAQDRSCSERKLRENLATC